ncbi:MAG: hypothetical protein HFJ45_04590 [Clostridia bacterium]|nr:hypothetical protein [Clostridia bacterium]
MKFKKLIIGMLLIVILISQLSFISFNNYVYAQESNDLNNQKFHYEQLNDLSKKVYNGIYDMYIQGILKTGNGTYDIAADDKYVTQQQLEDYMKGSTELKAAVNAARYAFYADYPEVFYVNFQCLDLRVTKDSENRYHANIGSGKLKSYYVEGFTSETQVDEAIVEFNDKVDEIVNGANNLNIENGKNSVIEKIKYVHNEIINNTGYRLESDCIPGNEGFISTPYGALVKKQAVCEGYARALKVVLDKMGINNILVQGTHQTEGYAAVPHMWNYVEIEKETVARSTEKVWYAIDATLDDPFLRDTTMDSTHPDFIPGSDITEGFENTRYCMVGTETMNKEHVALGTVEAAGNYTFIYPELYSEDYGIDTVVNNNGLLVKFKQEGTETEEYRAGDFYISYNNKGYVESTKDGKYILMKYHEYRPGDDKWIEGKWGYFLPDVYAGGFIDYDDHVYVSVPNSEYVEFAVTTLAPGDYKNDIKYLSYQGDGSDFVAQSGKLYNPNGTYKAAPYIKTQTPAATATLTVGPTYHVDVTYTDDLILANGATEAGYRMESTGATGVAESKIENFTFDGKNRITFDLTFSKMFADDDAMYRIYITGLVGKNSNKEPNYISYGAYNLIACSFSMNAAKSWDVFARPTLLENEDLSMNGWVTSDGKQVSEKLKSRIALVTTRTTQTEKDTMNGLMEEQLGDQELITSETYNISLNVCKKYVVKTGHKLRLSLGFPKGYGPDDAGVTFKAYHFITNASGEVTGVEEIPCIVTQYGLIVTCNSFSPFAIAAVENDGTNVQTEKAIIVSATEGGQVNGANRDEGNIITLAENESAELNIVPQEGYEIESVTIFGNAVEVTNKDLMNINVNYNDVKDGNCIVDAKFVAKSVVEEEVQKGETLVQPTATPAEIKMLPSTTLSQNRDLLIVPEVSETSGIQTYQWYKDDVKLEGKTNKVLKIENCKVEDSGNYVLKVTTTVDTLSEETVSTPCVVTIKGFNISMSSNKTTNLQNSEEFEVTVNLNNIRNINDGLISLAGQLEYDSEILERIEIVGQNGWTLDNKSFNEENLKFIIENEQKVNVVSDILKIKFKVKDTAESENKTVIKIKGISASGGEVPIYTADSEIEIGLDLHEKPTEITSDKYVIDEKSEIISRIAPNTTVAQFKNNITANKEIVVLDKDGNVLKENAILGTGMQIKVGKTTQFKSIVIGDLDGDGEITILELAKIKLHYIDAKHIETEMELMAADLDADGEITINDIAQVKLVIIGLKVID